jgi:hypothetical protein
VPTLNDVGPQMLEELRRLESRSQLDYYLAFHIAQRLSRTMEKALSMRS